MTTKGQRIRQIMEDERHHSMRKINELPEPVWEPGIELFAAIQATINDVVQKLDGAIPADLSPTILRIAADEMERIGGRLSDEGLLYGADDDAS